MNKPTLRPLQDRILVEPPPSTDTPGMVGLVHLPENVQLPELNKLRHLKVRVLAVGGDCKLVKVGDWIVVTKQSTYEVNVDGTAHLMVDEKMVLAVVG